MSVEEVDLYKPNPVVIERLEQLVEEAKKGQIQGVAVATYGVGCETSNMFFGGHYPMHLIGELRCLERDLIDCCVETRRQPMWEFCE